MAGGERGERVGSLRVPRIWYRNRVTVAMVLAAGLLSAVWQVHSTRLHWDDVFTGLVDLHPVLLCVWFWLSSLSRVVFRWIVGAVCRYGVCRLLTLLLFFGVAATALGVFFLGSLNDYVWKSFVKTSFIQKMDENILKISDSRDLSSRVEPHPETNGKSAPHLLETFERFNGEDVMFKCESSFVAHEDAILHSGMIIWMHNYKVLNISSRRSVNTSLQYSGESRSDPETGTYIRYSFHSELRIYLLEEADYGEYSCLVYKDYYLSMPPERSENKTFPTPSSKREPEGKKRHECPTCTGQPASTFFPHQPLLDALVCVQENFKDLLRFYQRLQVETQVPANFADRMKYESYVNEFEYRYYCNIKLLKMSKKRSMMAGLDSTTEALDDIIKDTKATGKKMIELLHKIRPVVWKASDFVERTIMAGEFHLVQVTERLEQMTAAPGAMFSFSGVFHYLEDSDAVFVTYEISDRPVDFCEESVGDCSKIVFLYWLFFRDGGSYWDLLRNIFHYFPSGCSWLVNRREDYTNRLYMEFWKCLCYSSFGTHKFIFHREFYNASVGRITVHSFPHPHGVYIAPRPSELFRAFRNTSGKASGSPIETCWGTHTPGPPEHPCDVQEQWLMESIDSFWRNETTLMAVVAFVWTLVLGVGLVCFPLLLGWHGRRVILEGEVFPRILPPSRAALGGLAPTPAMDRVHDVFISYAEEQSSLAETSLANFLETTGLKVFLRKRDIALGSREHAERVGAIDLSQRFLVVVSPAYVEDPLLNDHEFQYILALVHDGLRHQHDVLLYLAGDCDVPHVLHAYPRLDATRLSDLDLRTRLLAWAGRAPVTLAGWRAWVPGLPVWSCAAVCLLVLVLSWEFLHVTSSL